MLVGERSGYGQQLVGARWPTGRRPSLAAGGANSNSSSTTAFARAEVFPDEAIFSAVRREINWTHVKTLIYVEDPLKRNFYIELCRLEGSSSRPLQERIQSMLFERSAIARKPTEAIQQKLSQLRDARRVTPELVLKDPYILDFLGPNDRYLEQDLEDAILREMEQFLLELGVGFTYVARQKRLQIG